MEVIALKLKNIQILVLSIFTLFILSCGEEPVEETAAADTEISMSLSDFEALAFQNNPTLQAAAC